MNCPNLAREVVIDANLRHSQRPVGHRIGVNRWRNRIQYALDGLQQFGFEAVTQFRTSFLDDLLSLLP